MQMPDDARRWLLDVWRRQADDAEGDAPAEGAGSGEDLREGGERADGAAVDADAGEIAGEHSGGADALSGGSSGGGDLGGGGARGVAGLPRETAGDDVD